MVDLIKPKAHEGEWFAYGEDGRIKVRRIPGPKALELRVKYFGKRFEFEQRRGTQYFGMAVEQQFGHEVEGATFALVDCENLRCPVSALEGTKLANAGDAEGMVILDGRLDDEVKTEILGESDDLRGAVLKAAKSLEAKTLREEEELGKI